MVKGWVEKPLCELFDFSGGVPASRAELIDKGYLYLHYGDIHATERTYIDASAEIHMPRLNVDLNKVPLKALLNDGDVVFVDASEDYEGASRHVVVRNCGAVPFISGLHTIVAKAKTDELVEGFREFCFQTATVKSQFNFYAVGTKVVGVNKSTIGKIMLRFPQSKREQRAIAAALSDTEALIAALEKLVGKKRDIKQGAMQGLLTGKRRLEGFAGEWAETTVRDTGIRILSGYAFRSATYVAAGRYKIVTIANVQQNRLDTANCSTVNQLPADLQEHQLLRRGDILISLTGNVGRTCQVNEDALALNQRVGLFANITLDKMFFYYVLQDTRFIDEMALRAKGGAQPNLSNKDIYSYQLMCPPTRAEQTAIADILSGMDAEIQALAAQLAKLRDIKQGMISELLTGRVRLIQEV